MSEKFTESMEVVEIGTIRLCHSVPICSNFEDVTGVLLEGITSDAAKLLYEKVEIVPAGTKARFERLEASNAVLLEALKDCCVIAKPENPASCCPNYQPLPDGDCAEAKNGDCHIWKAIQKAGAGMKDYGKTVKFTSEGLIKATGSDFIAEVNEFFGQSGKNENQHLKDWITKLERENHELKDETVRIYQQMLSLYRAVKKANLELDKIEEKCDNNVWFSRLKERTY